MTKKYLSRDDYFRALSLTQLVSIDLLIVCHEKLLVGKRSNNPAQGSLFVPGGKVYKNEYLTEGLERISKQEIGFSLNTNQVQLKASMTISTRIIFGTIPVALTMLLLPVRLNCLWSSNKKLESSKMPCWRNTSISNGYRSILFWITPKFTITLKDTLKMRQLTFFSSLLETTYNQSKREI